MNQFLHLIGVYDDGTPIVPPVPQNTARTITIPRGCDVTIAVQVTNNGGVPTLLTSPTTLTLTVNKILPPLDRVAPLALVKTAALPIPPSQPNIAIFTLVPQDTAPLIPGRYWYDVQMTYGGKNYQVVASSILVLSPAMVLP